MTRHSDMEEGSEETPLMERERATLRKSRRKISRLLSFLKFFGGGIYAPDASTFEPIDILLNAETREERDRLTEQWRDNRLAELNFVGVVAALLCGVLTSTGSWPDILPGDLASPWPVRSSWYCGIILSLFSILSAADQTVRLRRLSSHRDAFMNIRNLLSKPNIKANGAVYGRVQPNKAQIYTWQLPTIFLTTSAVAMIVGMFLHVWSATRHLDRSEWWDGNSKVALTFTIVALVSIILFFAGQVTLYAPDNELVTVFAIIFRQYNAHYT